MNRPETDAHLNLKRLALAWAQQEGFALCAAEVSLPRCPYRADIAAATARISSPRARVAVFECKQSRSDWLRDSAPEGDTRLRAQAVAERLRLLRELVAAHRPDLRRGEALFAEFDSYDYRGLRHATLHRLEAELGALQRKLSGSVKFDRLGRYPACDLRYLVTEDGLAAEHEIPVGWGWLVRAGDALELRAKPVLTPCGAATRIAVLERIARAGTRLVTRALRDVPSRPPSSAPARADAPPASPAPTCGR